MRRSLKALLADSLDYAGMFPPASLSLEDSFARYTEYRRHQHAWMLSRFVCPVDRVGDLASLLEASSSPAVRLSILGKAAAKENWLGAIEQDFQRMGIFLARVHERVNIETYERLLPADINAEASDDQWALLAEIRRISTFNPRQPPTIVFELPSPVASNAWLRQQLEQFPGDDREASFAFKLRTGGTEAKAFPSPSAVATFIAACREANCPWKATAGLHEPLSEMDRNLNVWRFGFLNLFGAAVLSHVHKLSPGKIEPILREPSAAAFRFENDSFTWRDLSATCDQIAAARRHSLMSGGSCSFDEPIQGLQRLELLAD